MHHASCVVRATDEMSADRLSSSLGLHSIAILLMSVIINVQTITDKSPSMPPWSNRKDISICRLTIGEKTIHSFCNTNNLILEVNLPVDAKSYIYG